MLSQPWAATISDSFCRAVALFHMLGVSAMILMLGMLGEDRLGGLVAPRIHHGAGNAAHENDVALALELLGQPFGRTGAGPVLVDADIVGAGLGHLRIPGDEDDALGAGVLTARLSAVGEIGQATMMSAPAWTMALICCSWVWASPRADWMSSSTRSL